MILAKIIFVIFIIVFSGIIIRLEDGKMITAQLSRRVLYSGPARGGRVYEFVTYVHVYFEGGIL